jgi:hypothetical protein
MEPPHRYSVVSSQGDYCLSSSNTAGQHSRQSSISYGGRPPSAQSSIRPSTCRSGRSSSIRPGTPGLCFMLVSRLSFQWLFEFPLFNAPRDDGLSKYSKRFLLLERGGRIQRSLLFAFSMMEGQVDALGWILNSRWRADQLHSKGWWVCAPPFKVTASFSPCHHLFGSTTNLTQTVYVHAADPSHIEIWSTVSPCHMSHCRWAKQVFDGHSRLYKILSILNYLAFAGPGRQVLDKSYYMSRLRSKKQELQSEINSMSDEIEHMQRRGPAAFQLEQK